MVIELPAEPPVHIKIMGRHFRVLAIGQDLADVQSVREVNDWIVQHPDDDPAVIHSESGGPVYIASKQDIGVIGAFI